jgi:hypothetical protein
MFVIKLLKRGVRASTCREISLQKEILACARKRARKSNLPGNGKEI